MSDADAFKPDWVSPPGETVADLLEERDISPAALAAKIGTSAKEVSDLLSGSAPITPTLAAALQRALGPSEAFWLAREEQYRNDLARLQQTTADKEWLSALPVADMIKFGWIPDVSSRSERLAACLRFFGARDMNEWRAQQRGVYELAAAFRTSPAFTSDTAAVSAWLRRGEILAAKIDCQTWNPTKLRDSLPELRALTRRKDPGTFVPDLTALCAACGIAVVVARAPKGCRASGATRFLSPGKALLLLSFRYLSDDHFWFTVFHEIGHLLLHGKERMFLEGIAMTSREEEQANSFAADVLIPPSHRPAMLRLRTDPREVIRFAQTIGVSPGIVVGQLQHLQLIKRDQLNKLKRWYEWD